MGRGDEIRAAGRLTGDVLAGGVGLVEDVHRAIARRAFAVTGTAAHPVRLLHDTVSSATYGAIKGAHALIPRVGAGLTALRTGTDTAGWAEASAGRQIVAALNGLWGDTMARSYPELSVNMAVVTDGSEVAMTPETLEEAFPRASGRMAVFVHGLCETDESWRRNAADHYGDTSATYGSMLQRDLGYTPVFLRYNTGLHVSDNGRQLAALLDALAAAWPVPVGEIVLVGHSMGGLVARSACHYAERDGRPWTRLVTHVFCLGTPHLGAPLEKGVHAASRLAGRLPETRPIAKVLKARSDGVKDLRFGACVEDDWLGEEAAGLWDDPCTDVPFLAGAAYYFVGVSVTNDSTHPLGALVGDLLVRFPSASGRGRRRTIPFEVGHGRHIGGLHHLDLLNHPAVYEQLHDWLASSPAGVALSDGNEHVRADDSNPC
ncbi:MAG: alpha/beta fold hydrolase [Acidimicrobiales bacterium]